MDEDTAVEQHELAFATAGDRLREAREKQEKSLEQVAAETRIPIRHLEAIEAGNFASLPARTYAVGFSRTFAQSVGLDEEVIVNLVRDEMADSDPYSRQNSEAMQPGDAAKLPSSGLAWFGAFAAVLLVAGLLAAYTTYFAAGQGPGSLIEQAAQQAAAQDIAGATSTDAAASEAAVIDAQGAVVFTALEDGVWARFYENSGDRLLEKQMSAGERFELPADAEDPRINTGRPDAFAITIGGREVPKLSEEPITIGDAPISASALLARDAMGEPGA